MLPNIRFDLWPDGCFDQEDVKEIEKIISPIDTVEGRTSSNLRGVDIQIAFEFIGLAIASTFFAKLTEDIYEITKKKLISLIHKPIDIYKKEGRYVERDGGFIWISSKIGYMDIRITCIFIDEQGINDFINKTNIGLKWLNKSISNNEIDIKRKGEIRLAYCDRQNEEMPGWHYTNKLMEYEVVYFVDGKEIIFTKGTH